MNLLKHQIEHEALGLEQHIIDLVRKYRGGAGTAGGASGGVSTFLALTDTPSTYVGQSLLGVRVNAAETALEFYSISTYTDEQAQDAVGTILTDSSTIDFTYNDGANTITATVIVGGLSGIDHGSQLTGLGDDDHTQYALLLGRSGGQTLIGGTGASENLTLTSTSNGTKGVIAATDPVQVTQDNLTTSSVTGLRLQNTTLSTAGVPNQYSPAISWIGHARITIGAADRFIRFHTELQTANGTPTGTLVFKSSVDTGTGSFTDRMYLVSTGNLLLPTAGSQFVLGGSTVFSGAMQTTVTTSTNKIGLALIGAATDGSTSSSTGVGLVMSHNGASNTQAVFGDLGNLTSGSNANLRFAFIAGTATIDAVDGAGNRKNLAYGSDTTQSAFGGLGFSGTTAFGMQDTRVGAVFFAAAGAWSGGFDMTQWMTGGGSGTILAGVDTLGSFYVSRADIRTTSTQGIYLKNTTAATVSITQQYSPRLEFNGTAWKSNATAVSQVVSFALENRPQTGAAAATGNFVIMASIAAGGYTDLFTLSSWGRLVIAGAFAAGVVTLSDGATPALDASLGNTFLLTAAGNRTIAVPTNATSGQKITIVHKASGADRTLALNTGAGGFRFGTDITGLTATTNGKTDYIGAIYNAADSFWDVVAYTKGF